MRAKWMAVAAVLAACSGARSFVRVNDVALGRVVVYRNGVAYYERQATIRPGQRELHVVVPADKVDDFLKSLTVLDRDSGTPLPVSFPHQERAERGTVDMTIGLPDKGGTHLVLTYITDAPSWKPSYRVEVKDDGHVLLQGWAIVDNTSGEDWKDVLLGVGSSSAMSFRYDLWSIRSVDRKTLSAEERFGAAPPMGGSPYAQQPEAKVVLGSIASRDAAPARPREAGDVVHHQPAAGMGTIQGVVTDETTGIPMLLATVVVDGGNGPRSELTDADGRYAIDVPPGRYKVLFVYGDAKRARDDIEVARGKVTTVMGRINTVTAGETITIKEKAPSVDAGSTTQGLTIQPNAERTSPSGSGGSSAPPRAVPSPSPPPPPDPVAELAAKVKKSPKVVVVEGYGAAGDRDPQAQSAARADELRNALIERGVPPAQLRAEGRGLVAGQPAGVRLVASDEELAARAPAGDGAASDAPVGESDFRSDRPVTVLRATSVMLSTIRELTDGQVVYLYDPESPRGNARFAFRAVRFANPTPSTLDTGPLTVYGDGRFIGEGLAEPIAAHGIAVVPFALDRQIVVERDEGSEDRIAALLTLERGRATATVQHVKKLRLVVTNRLTQKQTLYVRHTVAPGWELLRKADGEERLGDARLFKVELDPNGTRTLEIEEATPLRKTLDLRTPAGLDLVRVYVSAPGADPRIAEKLKEVLALHRDVAGAEQRLGMTRARLGDLRVRMDELHAQLVSLEAVKTKGKLMDHLQAKMKDVSERVHDATLAELDAREKLAVAQLKLQDAVAELTL